MPQLRRQFGVSGTGSHQEPGGRRERCGNLWKRAPSEDYVEDELWEYRAAADSDGDSATAAAEADSVSATSDADTAGSGTVSGDQRPAISDQEPALF